MILVIEVIQVEIFGITTDPRIPRAKCGYNCSLVIVGYIIQALLGSLLESCSSCIRKLVAICPKMTPYFF